MKCANNNEHPHKCGTPLNNIRHTQLYIVMCSSPSCSPSPSTSCDS